MIMMTNGDSFISDYGKVNVCEVGREGGDKIIMKPRSHCPLLISAAVEILLTYSPGASKQPVQPRAKPGSHLWS